MEEGHLFKAATELAQALDRVADQNLPTRLADLVKLHAKIAVGSAFIPIPGADMAAAGANIWTMYVRINKELALPFGENAVKSLAAGVVTNLAGGVAGFLVAGSAFKLVPGLGSLGGAAIMAGTTYGVTIASGIVYMKAVTKLLLGKALDRVSAEDLERATREIASDRETMREIIKDARKGYKDEKMRN
jgi:uncharacterized protein (DUF697 family)